MGGDDGDAALAIDVSSVNEAIGLLVRLQPHTFQFNAGKLSGGYAVTNGMTLCHEANTRVAFKRCNA